MKIQANGIAIEVEDTGAGGSQAVHQACVRGGEQARLALHPELDVPAPLRMVDARKAEDLDARELGLDGFHQRRE